ncbi:MAG: PAS domain S-box protein [Smithella sp.]
MAVKKTATRFREFSNSVIDTIREPLIALEQDLRVVTATRSREFSNSVIDTIREPLIALDQDLRVVTASRSFYEFFKVKPEETEGQLIYDLGNKQWDIPKLRDLLETILPQKTTFDNYEIEHDFATIGRRTMLLNARQIQRVLGKERIILLAIEDITEHKRLEDILTESEELYKGVFNTASDGIFLLEKREGKIIHINPSAEKMLGYSTKESIGNKLHDVGFIFDMGDFQTMMQNLNKNGIINYTNVPLTTKSGQFIYTDIYLVNKTKVVQCNIRDITERKSAQETLRETEERFAAAFHASPNLIAITRMVDGKILDINEGYSKLLGYSRGESIGRTTKELSIWADPADRATFVGRLEKFGEINGFETTFRRNDGTLLTVLNSARIIELQGEKYILLVAYDITERKQAEDALKESERKYRLLADNIQDVIFVLDMNLKYTYISPSVKTMRGYEPEEVLKQQSIEHVLTPSSHDLAMKTISDIMELEKSGPRENAPLSRTFQLEMKRKDGTTLWTEVKFSFIRDENQRPIAIMGVTRDITERKKADEKLLQILEKLRKAFGSTIQVMVSAVEMRDPYTAGHQLQVANLACAIAREMGLPDDKIEGIQMAGFIHDIGKLSIPAEILSKPTKLTNLEFSLIKEHPQSGYEMLKNVDSPWPLAQIVYQHHERTNGSGYPRNLKGDEILPEARIMAVADVVEAMASHRPYRASLGIEAALEEIEKNKGILYDDAVADACLRLFREKGYQLT